MPDDDARTFFNHTVPALLAGSPERGDALCCRIVVSGVSAWEIDFRLPSQRCTEVGLGSPVEVPPSVHFEELALTADGFAQLRSAGGAALDSLHRSTQSPRACATLSSLLRAPPLEWPPSLRVIPLHAGFFVASRPELEQAMPRLSLDAERAQSGAQPRLLEPPFPYVNYMAFRGYWWEDLAEFHQSVVPGDAAALEPDGAQPADDNDLLGAIYGEPMWLSDRIEILSVPGVFVSAVAALSDEALAAATPGARRWDLTQLRPLAQRARAEERALWFWGCHE
jgi:hypothetical protein